MNIAEFKRIQQAYAKAENAWLVAMQDPNAEPVFVKFLRNQADLAKRDYEQAFRVMQGSKAQTAK